MKILIGTLLILLCAGQAVGQKCKIDSGFRGGSFSISYEQRHLVKFFQSLDELPSHVKARLDEYLQRKLGPDFTKRIEFDGGQWLDLQKLRQEFPELYEKNRRSGTYDLLFRFSDPAKGLKFFYAKVALNEDGSINEEMRLPNIGAEPNKAHLISCTDAIHIAVRQGFPKKRISPWFEYSPEHDCFIWILTDTKRIDSGMMIIGNGTYRKMDVNANTGEILRVYKQTIVL